MKEYRKYICNECFLEFEVIGGDPNIEICPDCGADADRYDDLPKKEGGN